MGLRDFKELIDEHGIAVLYTALVVGSVLGTAAFGAGFYFGGLPLDHWKYRTDAAERLVGAVTEKAHKAEAELKAVRAELASVLASYRKSVSDLNERTAFLKSTSDSLAASEKRHEDTKAELDSKNAVLAARDKRVAELERRIAGPSTPAAKPRPTTHPLIQVMYRKGDTCSYHFMDTLKVPDGFVQTQLQALKGTGLIITGNDAMGNICAALTSAGRTYAENNGLDKE